MGIVPIKPPPPPKPGKNYKWDNKQGWVKKSQWDLDYEKALEELEGAIINDEPKRKKLG